MSAIQKPPRERLYRAIAPGPELRVASDGSPPIMSGHFAVFNQFTEIDSVWEGRFMERIAPGAFAKTIKENQAGMRVLLNHGQDPHVGDKPLGPIVALREDDYGAAYEVQLLDTSYNRDIIPGLDAGLYGASFRFSVLKEELVESPKPSATNPRGLPERTIQEARVMEFGPVTFPAYEGATAGVRSVTDRFALRPAIRALREQRADMPTIGLLADMYEIGQQILAVESDPEDAPDRDVMAQVMELLEGLVETEATEDPAAGGGATEAASNSGRHALPSDGAASRHSGVGSRATERADRRDYLKDGKEAPTWLL